MGITLELLMVTDGDIEALIRKPKSARAFIDSAWGVGSEDLQTRRSMGIRYIFDRIDYVLQAGAPAAQLPLGFLQADEHIIGKVKKVHRLTIGDEVVQWNEYEGEYYGPPSGFRSDRVSEIHQALAPVNDGWVRNAYNPDDLTSENERQRLTPSDHDARIQECQEVVRELKIFISRAASAQMGLIRYIW